MSVIQQCQYPDGQYQKTQCRQTGQSARGTFKSMARTITLLWRRYAMWLRMKEQHRQLMVMDDRMLKDIGLSRADAVRITTGPRFWPHITGRSGLDAEE